MLCCLRLQVRDTIVLTNSQVTRIVPEQDEGWKISFSSVNNGNNKSRINLLHSRTVHARLVISATGRCSNLIQRKISKQILYDNLIGLAVRFHGECEHTDSFTLVESVEYGWWYSCGIPGGDFIVVLMTDADIMIRNRFAHIQEWMKCLMKTTHTKVRVQNYAILGGPNLFPASR